MKKVVNKLIRWMSNTSLRFKISLLVLAVGIIPSGAILILSLNRIQKQNIEQQLYSINQGYEQILLSIKDKMDSAHNIAMLLAVNDIYNTGTIFSDETDEIAKQLDNFNRINSYSYGMELAFDSCEVIYYINDDFQIVNNFSSRFHSINDIADQKWYQELDKNETVWACIEGKLSIARNLYSQDDYTMKVGVLVVSLDSDMLEELLINSEKEQIFFIVDADGNVLLTNDSEHYYSSILLDNDSEYYCDEFKMVETDFDNYYYRYSEISDSDIYLFSIVPSDSLKKANNEVMDQTRYMYILMAALIIILIAPITRLTTKKLKLIGDTMEEMKDGSLKKINSDGGEKDEISRLIHKYNDMVDTVEESLKQQYALGEEKKDAELRALQSQINPHFLYNTLDMINWMAQKNEKDNVREVIQAMSKFYRMTLSKGEDIITIRDELNMCEAYMNIQKKRFKGRINYIQNVEDDIYDCLIPKITLQPIIENAIVHGINEKKDLRGMIRVDGWQEDGRIILSVTDDGVGFHKDDNTGNGSHYGMKNIQKRLEVFYGEKIELQVESTVGIGTCVIINIPVILKKGE
jgi:two-component system sensor histidine kinase YesM